MHAGSQGRRGGAGSVGHAGKFGLGFKFTSSFGFSFSFDCGDGGVFRVFRVRGQNSVAYQVRACVDRA